MKMQQSKRNKAQFVHLPREITIDILSRLPTRTIITCKVVCKAWRDAIECVDFTRFLLTKPYLIISTDPFHKIFGLKGGRSPLLSEVSEFRLRRYLGVRGTVNGLILLGEVRNLFVCNPTTREFVKLPNHQPPYSSFNYNSYGLGVSRTSGQYKVVRIFQQKGIQSGCQVYTIGTKEWRATAMGAPSPSPPRPTLKSPTNTWNAKCAFAGGNLYWLDHRTQTEVCCFDLETEAFASFGTPPAPIGHRGNHRSLSVLDDRLSLCDMVWTNDWSRSGEVEIWLMRGGGDWSKEYLIRDACGTSLYAFPIKVLEDGAMLLCERNRVGRYAKRGDEEASGYRVLYPEGCCEYVFDNASVYNLSFLSLKTLGEDVKKMRP